MPKDAVDGVERPVYGVEQTGGVAGAVEQLGGGDAGDRRPRARPQHVPVAGSERREHHPQRAEQWIVIERDPGGDPERSAVGTVPSVGVAHHPDEVDAEVDLRVGLRQRLADLDGDQRDQRRSPRVDRLGEVRQRRDPLVERTATPIPLGFRCRRDGVVDVHVRAVREPADRRPAGWVEPFLGVGSGRRSPASVDEVARPLSGEGVIERALSRIDVDDLSHDHMLPATPGSTGALARRRRPPPGRPRRSRRRASRRRDGRRNGRRAARGR